MGGKKEKGEKRRKIWEGQALPTLSLYFIDIQKRGGDIKRREKKKKISDFFIFQSFSKEGEQKGKRVRK